MIGVRSSDIFTYMRELEGCLLSSHLNTQLVKQSHERTSNSIKNPSSLFHLLFGFLLFSALVQRSGATTLTTNLVAHYPFNGNANDMSGNGNHGIVHSATLASDRFGTANSAYGFDGSSTYIEITNGNAFNFANQFSISAWIKPVGTQAAYAGILDKSHGNAGWTVALNAGVDHNFLYLAHFFAPSMPYINGYAQLASNNWDHFVITKQDTTVNTYLNNVLIATGNPPSASITSNSNLPLIIGAWNSANSQPASGLTRYFNGLIDEIRIYNRALSVAETAELYLYGSPTAQPSKQPTMQPSVQPSHQPTVQPSAKPSSQPTQPSSKPSGEPSSQPSHQPTEQPSTLPSAQPSSKPTNQPTEQPSAQPRSEPTNQPSDQPTEQPSVQPSSEPTNQPSDQPSAQPSVQPSSEPTNQPSDQPSAQPSGKPTVKPSAQPISEPTSQPSTQPSGQPSEQPTTQPSDQPSEQPTTQPSAQPSEQPTAQPSDQPSEQPSAQPSDQPTEQPSAQPSGKPTVKPSAQPISEPTSQPSTQPSGPPSEQPTAQPSDQPSEQPSTQPSDQPSEQPSTQPSDQPSEQPTTQPSGQPSEPPSTQPSGQPTKQPSAQPSNQPSEQPTANPSNQPTEQPSAKPSNQPSEQPTSQPSDKPSEQPTVQPSDQPTAQPSVQPSSRPTSTPSYSQAPTILTPRNWTAQIIETSLINGIAVLNEKTIACGGIFPAICLQFDNPTGKLSATYGMPWDINNAITAVDDDFVMAGQWNGQQYVIARFNVLSQQLEWGFKTSLQQAAFQAVTYNQYSQEVVTVGYDLKRNVVAAAINKDNGKLVWGYTYQIAGVNAFITTVEPILPFTGLCMAGYVTDSRNNYKTSILIMRINLVGSLASMNTLAATNGDTQANAITIDSSTGDDIIAGAIYQYSASGNMNALITRLHGSSVSWAIEYKCGSEGEFTDVLMNDKDVFVVGYSAGFSPNTQKKDLIVMQLDAENGDTIKAVRISGPGNTICKSMSQVENGLRIACSAEAKATLFFLDENTLTPGNLPPGYTYHDDVQSVLIPASKSLVITTIPLLQAVKTTHWSPGVLQPLVNQVISSPSFTQSWPENFPSTRPTRAPTVFPPTPWPSTRPSVVPSTQPSTNPSSNPSGEPTSTPSISFQPTGHPSSSVPTITFKPMSEPTYKPTVRPSKDPTKKPTENPSHVPTHTPSQINTRSPTIISTVSLTNEPSLASSYLPTETPSNVITTPHPSIAATLSDSTNVPSIQTTFFQSSKRTDKPDIDYTLLLATGGSMGLLVVVYLSRKYIANLPGVANIQVTPESDIENQLGSPVINELNSVDKYELPSSDPDELSSVDSNYEYELPSSESDSSMCQLSTSDSDTETLSQETLPSDDTDSLEYDSDSEIESLDLLSQAQTPSSGSSKQTAASAQYKVLIKQKSLSSDEYSSQDDNDSESEGPFESPSV